jgi:hypothetical protein
MTSQGVRQLCPEDIFASAPGGSDSILSASFGGDDFMKLKLGRDAEHAAKLKPHATTAMTRRMIISTTWSTRWLVHPLGRKRPQYLTVSRGTTRPGRPDLRHPEFPGGLITLLRMLP